MTNDTFIVKANNVHHNKYDYTLVDYFNAHTKVKIICSEHGVFEQTPNSHLSNHGCPKCFGNQKYTTKNFIEECQKIYHYKYDYSLVKYVNSHEKVKIICPEHDIFEKSLIKHRYQECPKCTKIRNVQSNRKTNIKKFIDDSNKIHNNKYDYSLVNYIGCETKVDIKCPTHGIFNQEPRVHITGGGCPKCANEKHGKYKLLTNDIFIKRSNKIHNNKYDYSSVNYINSINIVQINCPKHGMFEQLSSVHLNGSGCPLCQISKGEEKIKLFLDFNKIIYKKEHRFSDCRYKQPLKFDFYLPNYNMCIEYDGEQHFEKWHIGDTDENFNLRKERDEIKNKYCKKNNINLLRIKYTQFNEIENILIEKLKNKQLIYGINPALSQNA